MDVLSQCRLRAGSVVWQTRAGAWALTVVCKATYRLTPIESPVAEDQEEIYEDDTHWNDDESRSLAVASDLAPFKARADVVVVGHAFAPQKQPVRAFSARLCVGEVDKAIEVWCDRGFGQSGQLLEGPRITKMSLRYERAAGGPETSNPAGMRFDAPPDAYGMVAIPNLQPPGRHIAWRGETFDPIGFGPLAPTWPTRRDKLYRYAAGWPYRRWSERPLPEDVDPGYFNVAPRDQQVEALRSNERIVLEGLHPDHPRLVTSLVGVRPRAFAERQGQGREEVALVCDTLWIDTDRALCTLTWRGRIGLRHREEAGRVVITEEGAAARGDAQAAAVGVAPIAAESVIRNSHPQESIMDIPATAKALLASLENVSTDPASTLVPSPEQAASAARTPATPFQPAGSHAGHAHAGAAPSIPAGGPVAPPPLVDALKPVGRPPMVGPIAGAPGQAASSAGASVATQPGGPFEAMAALPVTVGRTLTLTGPSAPAQEPLPFKVGSAVVEPGFGCNDVGPAVSTVERRTAQKNAVQIPEPPLQSAVSSLAAERSIPAPSPGLRSATPEAWPDAGSLSATMPLLDLSWDVAPVAGLKPVTLAETQPLPGLPEPPPMIGPLARPDSHVAQSIEKLEPPPALPVDSATGTPRQPLQARPEAPALPLERCAAITASIARRREDEAAILKENNLEKSTWEVVKAHWTELIRKESGKGKKDLLRRFDAAYVEQLEKERGSIEVSEYARIAVASERGTVDDVLAELRLPRGALMRIERVWLERTIRDPGLGDKIGAAIGAARDK